MSYCKNKIIIRGSSLKEFEETLELDEYGRLKFSFSQIVPIPGSIKIKDINSWRLENWGTSEDAKDVNIEIKESEIIINCKTEIFQPAAWARACRNKIKGIEMEIGYSHNQKTFYGKYKNGIDYTVEYADPDIEYDEHMDWEIDEDFVSHLKDYKLEILNEMDF